MAEEVKQPQSRTTMVMNFYHEVPGHPVVSLECRSVSSGVSGDQPYQRFLDLDEEWVKLDTGWVTDPQSVVIHNRGLGNAAKTAQELELGIVIGGLTEAQKKLRSMHDPAQPPLQVVSICHLSPREFLPLTSKNLKRMVVRCTEGKTKMEIVAVPK